MPSKGRKNTKWVPTEKPGGALLKAMDILKEVLADGKEHHSSDLQQLFTEKGANWRHTSEAKKWIGNIEVNNRGRDGQYWKLLKAPEKASKTSNTVAAASQSSKVIGAKSVKTAPLRERISNALPGYDPVVSIAEIANDESIPIAVRLECHRDVAKYTVPQVKATEITTDDQPLALNFKWLD